MKLFTRFAAALAILSFIVNCGGGGAGGSKVESTQRPKTMDGIVMKVATGSSFEFVRSSSSAPALASGDIETGTFFYNFIGTNILTSALDNFIGSKTDVVFPSSITAASYTYRAVNANQGVLTLTGSGNFPTTLTGTYKAGNASNMRLFDEDFFFTSDQVEFDISWGANGGKADPGTAAMRIINSFDPFDRVRAPLTMTLKVGGSLPLNYNPVIDPNRPSKVVPQTLDDQFIAFTNTGSFDPNFNFTIQFITDATPPPSTPEGTEIGTGLMRINGAPAITPGVDYTFRPILGTDTAEVVITGSSTLDGSYILNFLGTDNGSYTGQGVGNTGTFLVN